MAFTITIPQTDLDLNKTLRSGQVFGWRHHENKWIGFIKNHIAIIEQTGDTIKVDGEVSKEDFEYYFDLYADYSPLLNADLNDYERHCIENGKGIRLLNQDFHETVITMLITPRNRIENTERICNALRIRYGKMCIFELDGEELELCAFPTVEELRNFNVDNAREIGCGFRAFNIVAAVTWLSNHPELPEDWDDIDDFDVITYLQDRPGIGAKVANCIGLFTMGRKNMFPIDVHLERIIEREFNGDIQLSRYNGFAGLMQQYMYYDEAIKDRR